MLGQVWVKPCLPFFITFYFLLFVFIRVLANVRKTCKENYERILE
nr:MAG TPA: peptidase [Caudoviricetes sp.]